MSDEKIKRNTNSGREGRSSQDSGRSAPEDSFESAVHRRERFRNQFMQQALPRVPEIDGYHLCWLSSTNGYDTIDSRIRIGYSPVKSSEMKGFNHPSMSVTDGGDDIVRCNEMILYKIPNDVYQDIMLEMHHYAPLDESEKVRSGAEAAANSPDAFDRNGRRLITLEGGIDDESRVRLPQF
jgi:hypothetical protein